MLSNQLMLKIPSQCNVYPIQCDVQHSINVGSSIPMQSVYHAMRCAALNQFGNFHPNAICIPCSAMRSIQSIWKCSIPMQLLRCNTKTKLTPLSLSECRVTQCACCASLPSELLAYVLGSDEACQIAGASSTSLQTVEPTRVRASMFDWSP